jgi:hypothetical protein
MASLALRFHQLMRHASGSTADPRESVQVERRGVAVYPDNYLIFID